MQIHLYIKTHNISGKKYFGQTTKDPFSYKGSGKEWLKHLKEFGNDVSTEILGSFDDREECASIAKRFSDDNQIAESDEWLNLIPEMLNSGGSFNANGPKCRQTMYEKYGDNYYQDIATYERSDETRARTIDKLRNHPNCAAGGKKNKGKVRETVQCPYCDKNGAKNVMLRWHFDNCKSKRV